jgi:stage V sporulation protein B
MNAATSASSHATSPATSPATSHGRGLAWITLAKVYFIVTSYAVQLLLPRFLGSAASFGLYATVMALISMLNNVLIVATVQTVSKRVSEDHALASTRVREALYVQLGVGSALWLLLFTATPWLGAHVLLDPKLVPLLRVACTVVVFYALYAVLVGALNGSKRFVHQARLDLSFSTLRTLGILLAAMLGLGALGALAGFALAALLILVVAAWTVGVGGPHQRPELRPWMRLMVPLWAYHLCVNGLMQVDLAVLKRTITELGLQLGHTAEVAATLASTQSAYYRAAQTFAFVPYQLILSVTLVAFPLLSQATSAGNLDVARKHITQTLRLSWLVLLGIASPIAGAAVGVMQLAYPDDYVVGASALQILVYGQVAFAMFTIATTILNSTGSMKTGASIAAVAVVIVVVVTRVSLRLTGLNGSTLQAAALGTCAGAVTALVVALWVIHSNFGVTLRALTASRGVVAAAVSFVAANLVPWTNMLGTLLAMSVGVAAYVLVLIALREIDSAELQLVKRALRRH